MLIKKNGQKGQVKMAVVADELEAVTDVCRAHIEDIARACKRVPLPRQQPQKETRAIVRRARYERILFLRPYLLAAGGEEDGHLCNRQVGMLHK